jgi:hypothetical protein
LEEIVQEQLDTSKLADRKGLSSMHVITKRAKLVGNELRQKKTCGYGPRKVPEKDHDDLSVALVENFNAAPLTSI